VAAVTAYSAPDDGRKGRPKHVKHTCSCYLCMLIVSLCYSCLCVVYVLLDAANLTEGFPCFFLRGKSSQDGARPALSQIVVLFYSYVLFILCRSVYCLCVNVYCTTATG